MDPVLVTLASTAGSVIVKAMASDAWDAVKLKLSSVLGTNSEERATGVLAELESSRLQIAELNDDSTLPEVEQDVSDEWRLRIKRLLRSRPDLATELSTVIDELKLIEGRGARQNLTQLTSHSHDNSVVFQQGSGAQHYTH